MENEEQTKHYKLDKMRAEKQERIKSAIVHLNNDRIEAAQHDLSWASGIDGDIKRAERELHE